jgi:hypothetical protein
MTSLSIDQLLIALKSVELAEMYLEPDEAYLLEEIQSAQESLVILLDKVQVEEALIRDRDALLSQPAGLGEHIGE